MMVEVLEQESKEPFTPSPSLIYQIVAGESYINCIVIYIRGGMHDYVRKEKKRKDKGK